MLTESEVIRIIGRHCAEQKLKFFAHVYRGTKGFILDGFAISHSYCSMKTIGYEIKVSRSDFLRDRKWYNYLPVCNTFYFVSPPNVIHKEELPKEIGLYHVVDGKLVCVKKAKRQAFDKEAVFEVLQYIALNKTYSERGKIAIAVREINRAKRQRTEAERALIAWRERAIRLDNKYRYLKRHGCEMEEDD